MTFYSCKNANKKQKAKKLNRRVFRKGKHPLTAEEDNQDQRRALKSFISEKERK